MIRRLLAWTAVALLGIVLAAGITYAASRLTSQRIGISSEPLEAGDSLAPKPAGKPRREPTTTTPAPATTTPPAPVTTTPRATIAPPGTKPRDSDGDADDD